MTSYIPKAISGNWNAISLIHDSKSYYCNNYTKIFLINWLLDFIKIFATSF